MLRHHRKTDRRSEYSFRECSLLCNKLPIASVAILSMWRHNENADRAAKHVWLHVWMSHMGVLVDLHSPVTFSRETCLLLNRSKLKLNNFRLNHRFSNTHFLIGRFEGAGSLGCCFQQSLMVLLAPHQDGPSKVGDVITPPDPVQSPRRA